METDFLSGGTVVVVIGSLEEAGFEVVQTDRHTSRDVCFVCKNSFSIGEKMFPLLEILMLLVKKTVIFQLTKTCLI